ncbi:hypothetical protein [Saccharopolyspora sp. NPDC050642]
MTCTSCLRCSTTAPRHLVATDDATPEHELATIRASGTEVRLVSMPPP